MNKLDLMFLVCVAMFVFGVIAFMILEIIA